MRLPKHVRVYLDYFDLKPGEYIPSEVSGLPACDIHHISPKGMGGSKSKDVIENLIALTRDEHLRAHTDPNYNEYLKQLHKTKL